MSGNPSALHEMLANMAHGGRIAMLGLPDEPFPIDWNTVIFDQLTLRGSVIGGPGVLLEPEITVLRQGEGDFRLPYPAVAQYDSTPTIFAGVQERTLRLAIAGRMAAAYGPRGAVEVYRSELFHEMPFLSTGATWADEAEDGWTLLTPPTAPTGLGAGDKAAALGRVQAVKPVALWSGLVDVPKSGKLDVRLDVPTFRGALRVMAVVAGTKRMGSASVRVVVRDPLTLQATLPRFLVEGDVAELPAAPEELRRSIG